MGWVLYENVKNEHEEIIALFSAVGYLDINSFNIIIELQIINVCAHIVIRCVSHIISSIE